MSECAVRQRVSSCMRASPPHLGRSRDHMEPSELREKLARAEEALSELEFSKQMRDEEYKALSHHSEALASELRRTRADLATARAAIGRQTSVAKEATMLEETLSSQVSQATNAKLAAAQEYRDAIEAHDAQVRRVVHELKNERERSTRLECELDEVREHWQKAHAKIQTLEEALQENLRIFEVWKQKEKKWRQERQALQQQKERHAQTLLFRKEELEHTRRELMRENQRLRSGLEGRRSPGKASRRSRSSRGRSLSSSPDRSVSPLQNSVARDLERAYSFFHRAGHASPDPKHFTTFRPGSGTAMSGW